MKKGLFILRNLYIFLFVIITVVIVFTPWLIRQGFSFFEEEALEMVIIGLLLVVSYIIYFLYKKEVEQGREELEKSEKHRLTLEERLDEAFKHIGQVNIQIEEVRSILNGFKKYPESKNDFKNILRYFSEKILSIVAADWVSFKIIDSDNFKTLSEHSQCRDGVSLPLNKIGNKDLINRVARDSCNVFCSDQDNLNIKAYCLMPKTNVTEQTEVFIKAVVNQLEMLFLIFSSSYYKSNGARTIKKI